MSIMEEARIWVYFFSFVGLIFIFMFCIKELNFGDIYLSIKEFIKQQFCIHKYKTVIRKDYGGGDFEKCTKCQKIK